MIFKPYTVGDLVKLSSLAEPRYLASAQRIFRNDKRTSREITLELEEGREELLEKTPLGQLGQIGCPEPRQILIKPFDPSILKDIEKAIQASDLGLNPSSDGKVIRLNLDGSVVRSESVVRLMRLPRS